MTDNFVEHTRRTAYGRREFLVEEIEAMKQELQELEKLIGYFEAEGHEAPRVLKTSKGHVTLTSKERPDGREYAPDTPRHPDGQPRRGSDKNPLGLQPLLEEQQPKDHRQKEGKEPAIGVSPSKARERTPRPDKYVGLSGPVGPKYRSPFRRDVMEVLQEEDGPLAARVLLIRVKQRNRVVNSLGDTVKNCIRDGLIEPGEYDEATGSPIVSLTERGKEWVPRPPLKPGIRI